MISKKVQSFLKRLVKGFVSGGLATVLVMLQTMQPIMQWSDLKPLALSLLVGFFTGSIMAIEKMMSWQDIQQ